MLRIPIALGVLMAAATAAHAADPDALWKITHDKCVPNEEQHGDPAPCALVDLEGGVAQGYVILKDLVGDTQYLLMPTAKITGIEDPVVLAPGTPNYFADAWKERHFTETAAKRDLPRDDLSLAVNSMYGRSQNQLHIHIDCIAPAVHDALQKNITAIGEKWAPFPEPLAGHRYGAIRVPSEDLDAANPFILLADRVPGARDAMSKETLVVIGENFPGGKPGFVILAGEADPANGDHGSGEELQDHSCALARQ